MLDKMYMILFLVNNAKWKSNENANDSISLPMCDEHPNIPMRHLQP